jgi:hypothetical protein
VDTPNDLVTDAKPCSFVESEICPKKLVFQYRIWIMDEGCERSPHDPIGNTAIEFSHRDVGEAILASGKQIFRDLVCENRRRGSFGGRSNLSAALLTGQLESLAAIHGPTLFGLSNRIDLRLVSPLEFRCEVVAMRYDPKR